MNTIKNSMNQLSELEMREIGGGGDSTFYKLGQGAKKVWCNIKDAWTDYCSNPHSSYGSYAGMNK